VRIQTLPLFLSLPPERTFPHIVFLTGRPLFETHCLEQFLKASFRNYLNQGSILTYVTYSILYDEQRQSWFVSPPHNGRIQVSLLLLLSLSTTVHLCMRVCVCVYTPCVWPACTKASVEMLSNLEVTTVEAIVVEELSEYGGRENLADSGIKVTSLVRTECVDASGYRRPHRRLCLFAAENNLGFTGVKCTH